jgi:microsomal dipeptidase-like Zn-dependent dipeptidase
LQKLVAILGRRGYSGADVAGVFHGNWLRFFTAAWAKN